MTVVPLRGQVFRADIGYGPKPWLVVSNNARNRNLESIIAVRMTTTSKHAALPTVVPLSNADPLVGYLVIDDIVQIYRDMLGDMIGVLTPKTMLAVSGALRIALP